jgi:hypothetical protein
VTTYNKSTLKTFFEQGDIPTGTNYADLIDSCLNLVETGNQSMAGSLTTTELITSRVSAANVIFGGTNFTLQVTNSANVNAVDIGLAASGFIYASAGSSVTLAAGTAVTITTGTFFRVDALTDAVLNTAGNVIVSGDSLFLNARSNASMTAVGNTSIEASNNIFVSAANAVFLNSSSNMSIASVAGDINVNAANNINLQSPVLYEVKIVSAAGTSQSTAAILSAVVNRGKGIVDGSTTGFKPRANKAGFVQYLYNEGASANLWPPVGGTINGLAANTPFSLAASAMITIIHLTASAMAAK